MLLNIIFPNGIWKLHSLKKCHMSGMAPQVTGNCSVYSTALSGKHQRCDDIIMSFQPRNQNEYLILSSLHVIVKVKKIMMYSFTGFLTTKNQMNRNLWHMGTAFKWCLLHNQPAMDINIISHMYTIRTDDMTLQSRHYGHDGVSNHQPRHCLLNRLFNENIKAPRHWPLCVEFTGDRWIPRTKGQ